METEEGDSSHHRLDGRKSRGGSRSPSRGDDGYDRRDSRRRRSKEDSSKSKRHKRDEDHHHRHQRHGHGSDSDASNVSSSSSSESSKSDRRGRSKHHSKKRHRKEKKKKKHHKKKKDRKHSKSKEKKRKKSSHRRSRSPSSSPPSDAIANTSIPAPPGAHELASALTKLFHSYPAMSSIDEGGIPLLFIQLGRGTEYNLSQMPDRNLAFLLGHVFEALKIHGMEIGTNGAWKWANAATQTGGRMQGDDLALLRLTRALLNGVGCTVDRVEAYEKNQIERLRQLQKERENAIQDQQVNNEERGKEPAMKVEEKAKENEEDVRYRKRIERMTSQMLDRFDPKNSSSSESSLANELQGICDVLMEGESIQLDGIENAKLRATLAQLFQLIGLELVEMEDEDEDDDEEGDGKDNVNENSNGGDKAMGYALPDITGMQDKVASNLQEVLRVCRFRSSGGAEDAPTAWAANPDINAQKLQAQEESSSDDDDGPAPLGTVAAATASKRKRPPPPVQNSAAAGEIDEGGREEWMMVPGEHDFLKGIQAGGAKSTRSRTFKNERNRGQSVMPNQSNAEKINPQVLEEVNAIQEAYQQSRGPSLLDAHRQKVQETKQQQQAAGQKKEWKWNRDKNLDDGRRVDKNALHMVLGGASTELKSKFQGSLGP